MVAATVLIPTHDHGPLLTLSLTSALAQTRRDIEIFVIGDGAPDVVADIVRGLADDRVRLFMNPKGPRHGEVHRHAALEHASGRVVCYLSDDDLWLPDHVQHMCEVLVHGDIASAPFVALEPDGVLGASPADLSHNATRRAVRAKRVPIGGLSNLAHTLDLYRRSAGWRTTPAGEHTDQAMIRRLLAVRGCRPAIADRMTVLHIGQAPRRGMSTQARFTELALVAQRIQTERGRHDLLVAGFAALQGRGAFLAAEAEHRRRVRIVRVLAAAKARFARVGSGTGGRR